jgi:hypothetical protein
MFDRFAASEFEPGRRQGHAPTPPMPVTDRLAARRERLIAGQMHSWASELWRGSTAPESAMAPTPSPEVSG